MSSYCLRVLSFVCTEFPDKSSTWDQARLVVTARCSLGADSIQYEAQSVPFRQPGTTAFSQWGRPCTLYSGQSAFGVLTACASFAESALSEHPLAFAPEASAPLLFMDERYVPSLSPMSTRRQAAELAQQLSEQIKVAWDVAGDTCLHPWVPSLPALSRPQPTSGEPAFLLLAAFAESLQDGPAQLLQLLQRAREAQQLNLLVNEVLRLAPELGFDFRGDSHLDQMVKLSLAQAAWAQAVALQYASTPS